MKNGVSGSRPDQPPAAWAAATSGNPATRGFTTYNAKNW